MSSPGMLNEADKWLACVSQYVSVVEGVPRGIWQLLEVFCKDSGLKNALVECLLNVWHTQQVYLKMR